MNPKISIIIPVYNVAPYIESCLTSVMNQIYENLEVVIVDDKGTDDSMEIVDKFCLKNNLDWLIINHKRNKGLSAARNTGVEYSTGDYLFFLDSDDELPLDAMQHFVDYLNKFGNSDFCIGNYIVDGNFNFKSLPSLNIVETKDNILNSYIRGEWYMMACGKLINRDFFIHNNLWFAVGRLHEDELFSFSLALSASKMIIIKEHVYKYIIRESSITVAKKDKNYIDMFWMIEQKIKLFQQYNYRFNDISFESYIVAILFQFSLVIANSNLSSIKQKVFMKWVKEQSSVLNFNKMTLKAKIKQCLIKLPYPCLNRLFLIIQYR